MEKKDSIFLEQLPYKNTNNSLFLHYFAANDNWNSGFDVPTIILENEACDFGTGLLMFYFADGYRMLENPDEVSSSTLKEWKDFFCKIHTKFSNGFFFVGLPSTE